MDFTLLQIVLLILPTCVFSSLAPRNSSVGLSALAASTWSTVKLNPIDPRFEVLPGITNVPLDEDNWLVSAVHAMGDIGSKPITEHLSQTVYELLDPNFRLVGVSIRPAVPGGKIEVRYVIWGFYLVIRGAIRTNSFKQATFLLCWQGQKIGTIYIWRRARQPALPRTKSTNNLQKTPFSNLSTISATGTLSSNNLDLAISLMDPTIAVDIKYVGRALPKHDIVMTIITCINEIASRTPEAQVSDPVIVMPPPFTVQLHIIPDRQVAHRPHMTMYYVAFSIKWIPGLLLRLGRWSEIHFDILIDGFAVAHGLLVKGSMSSPDETSIS